MAKDQFEDAFGEFTDAFRKNTKKTLKEMAKLVEREVKKNTSIADEHTPLWLKRNKHPYAGRPPLPHKKPLVHRVSGNLTDNVGIFLGDRKDELRVGVEEDNVPYVGWIVNGSTKMIARDFLAYSLLSVKRKLEKMVIKNYKKTTKKAGRKTKTKKRK
jgi:hypothetical protein